MNFSKTILVIVILVFIYVVFLVFSDFEKVVTSINEIDKKNFLLAIGIWAVGIGLRIVKWHFFLRRITNLIPFRKSMLYYLAGYAFLLSPGGVGEIIRSPFIMRDYGISISKTAPIVLVDRFYHLLAVTVIIGVGIIFSGFEKSTIVLPLGFVVTILLIIWNKPLFSRVLLKLSKIKFFKKTVPNVDESFEVIFNLMKARFFLVGTAISITYSILEAISVYLLIIGLSGNINFMDLIVIYHVSNFASAVSLIPGGIGVMEGGLVGLLVLFTIKYEIALSVVVLFRLISTAIFSMIGVISLRIISKNRHDS